MNATSKNSFTPIIKLGITLALYAVAACAILAIVNYITLPIITANKKHDSDSAMKRIFNTATSFEEITDFDTDNNSINNLYLAKEDGKTIGAVVQVTGATYDKARIILGVSKDLTIKKMEFLELSDSPGFGLKASDSQYKGKNGKTFYDQFTSLPATSKLVIGQDIDAITGATITTQGVTALVKKGCALLTSILGSEN